MREVSKESIQIPWIDEFEKLQTWYMEALKTGEISAPKAATYRAGVSFVLFDESGQGYSLELPQFSYTVANILDRMELGDFGKILAILGTGATYLRVEQFNNRVEFVAKGILK